MRLGEYVYPLLRFLRRFAAARDGVVAIILGIALLPIILLGGAAVDMRRISSAKSTVQAAADSAALAAANALRQGGAAWQARWVATNYVTAALEGSNIFLRSDVPVTVNGTNVTVTINASVPMTIMKIARMNKIDVDVQSTATYGATGGPVVDGAEVVLAIDTTQSMGQGGRLDAAKRAANTFIDKVTLMSNGSLDPTVRIGLVPFAKYVNIGTRFHDAPWLLGPDWLATSLTWDRHVFACLQGPEITENIVKTCYTNDMDPYDCSFSYTHLATCNRTSTNPNDERVYRNQWFGCASSEFPVWDENDVVDERNKARAYTVEFNDSLIQYDKRCPEPMIPLTTNIARVKTALGNLTPEGETYIAPGLLWAWRLLSPRSPFGGSAADGVKKSIILMTDGANTHSPYDPYDYTVHEGTNVSFANQKLLKICANAKAAGISIYTVAFMLTNEVIKQRLKTCASTPANYYDASSNDELNKAFADIGVRMTPLRLVR